MKPHQNHKHVILQWANHVKRNHGNNVNSVFSILTMHRVAIIFFELGVLKFHAKILFSSHFIITFFCKLCLIGTISCKNRIALVMHVFCKILWKIQQINGLVSSLSNSYSIRQPYPLFFKYPYISLKQSCEIHVKKDLIRIILFRTYKYSKLYIISYIFYVPIIVYICQTIHSFPTEF